MENSGVFGKNDTNSPCIAELYGLHDDVTTRGKGDTFLATKYV